MGVGERPAVIAIEPRDEGLRLGHSGHEQVVVAVVVIIAPGQRGRVEADEGGVVAARKTTAGTHLILVKRRGSPAVLSRAGDDEVEIAVVVIIAPGQRTVTHAGPGKTPFEPDGAQIEVAGVFVEVRGIRARSRHACSQHIQIVVVVIVAPGYGAEPDIFQDGQVYVERIVVAGNRNGPEPLRAIGVHHLGDLVSIVEVELGERCGLIECSTVARDEEIEVAVAVMIAPGHGIESNGGHRVGSPRGPKREHLLEKRRRIKLRCRRHAHDSTQQAGQQYGNPSLSFESPNNSFEHHHG